MDELEDLDKRARHLLASLASDPTTASAHEFDALLYEYVWRYLRHNNDRLQVRVARYLGIDGVIAPDVLPDEIDEVAHDATTVALRRVRQNAARFDPRRGTPTKWVIGAAEYAYVEVAKALVAARRSDRLAFHAPEDLLAIEDSNPSTEEHVLNQITDEQTLADAASHLSDQEFTAIRLVNTLRFSHAEVAEMIYGDRSMSRAVEGLLTRGRRKLAEAWLERRASAHPGAIATVADSTADKERDDE